MQKNNQKGKNCIKKWALQRWGILCFVCSVVLLVISGTLAAYTNFTMARRVVTIKDGSTVLFTSNLLYQMPYPQGGNLNPKSYRTRQVKLGEDGTFTLEVYNFAPGVTTQNDSQITYTLQITLLRPEYDSSAVYQIEANKTTIDWKTGEGANGAFGVKVGLTLEAGKRDTNTIKFKVPDNVQLQIEAIPDSNSLLATKNYMLASKITVGNLSSEKNWVGEIVDTKESLSPADYDGFNYSISGNGEGNITLYWDPTVFEISPWFIADLKKQGLLSDGVTTPSEVPSTNPGNDPAYDAGKAGWNYLQFHVGTEANAEAFVTQFYWKDVPKVLAPSFYLKNLTWEYIQGKIVCEFEATEPAEN